MIVTFKFVVKEPSVRLSSPNMFWKATEVLFLMSNIIKAEFESLVVLFLLKKWRTPIRSSMTPKRGTGHIWVKLVFSYQGQQAAFFARGRKIIHEGSLKTTRGKFQPEVWNEVSNRGWNFPRVVFKLSRVDDFPTKCEKSRLARGANDAFCIWEDKKRVFLSSKFGVPLFVKDFWNRTTQVYR